MNKYELVNYNSETKLWRIKALRDIPRFSVKQGALGGWVANEHTLSQEGNCWVSGTARVYGTAQVYGDARVYGTARVYGDARVYGTARVYGDARVYGTAQVYEDARVFGDVHVYVNAWVYGNAQVFGNAWVSGNAQVFGDARVSGDARITGDAQVYGDAQVFGYAWVSGDARVFGNTQVTKCFFIQQPKYNITTTDTHVFIGCEGHTWKTWEKDIQDIGTQHEYSQAEIEQTKAVLLAFAMQYNIKIDF